MPASREDRRYAAFAFAEAMGRLAGTWLLEHLGRTRLLVLGGLTAVIGFLASEFGLRAGLVTLSFLALAAATIAYLSRDYQGGVHR